MSESCVIVVQSFVWILLKFLPSISLLVKYVGTYLRFNALNHAVSHRSVSGRLGLPWTQSELENLNIVFDTSRYCLATTRQQLFQTLHQYEGIFVSMNSLDSRSRFLRSYMSEFRFFATGSCNYNFFCCPSDFMSDKNATFWYWIWRKICFYELTGF